MSPHLMGVRWFAHTFLQLQAEGVEQRHYSTGTLCGITHLFNISGNGGKVTNFLRFLLESTRENGNDENLLLSLLQ